MCLRRSRSVISPRPASMRCTNEPPKILPMAQRVRCDEMCFPNGNTTPFDEFDELWIHACDARAYHSRSARAGALRWQRWVNANKRRTEASVDFHTTNHWFHPIFFGNFHHWCVAVVFIVVGANWISRSQFHHLHISPVWRLRWFRCSFFRFHISCSWATYHSKVIRRVCAGDETLPLAVSIDSPKTTRFCSQPTVDDRTDTHTRQRTSARNTTQHTTFKFEPSTDRFTPFSLKFEIHNNFIT